MTDLSWIVCNKFVQLFAINFVLLLRVHVQFVYENFIHPDSVIGFNLIC